MSINKSWDPVWEKVFQEQEWGKYPSESLIRFIARNFYKKDRQNTKILEVGCGTGANIWYLSREGFDTYGIDGSNTGILLATKRLENENLKAHLSTDDILALPYENDFFDCVIDVECLYANNYKNSSKILLDIKRVLKKGGLFYSRTFSDHMFVGNAHPISENLEFKYIDEGPLAGKGFVRLSSRNLIKKLYCKFFNLRTVDLLEYSRDNGQMKISEWIIIGEKS